MKKIGFVDYYISEWHANNYPAWFRRSCEEFSYEFEVAYAYAELEISPVDGVTTEQWCEKFGAQKCDSIEELCEKSDFVVILAPGFPEKHLEYAEKVLKYGKRTYIDKTFAPDVETAVKIFELGKKYGAEFFSTSALRYAEELKSKKNVKNMITLGGGSNAPEYMIHQIEMLVSKLGVGAEKIKAETQGSQIIYTVKYGDDRGATMVFGNAMPFVIYEEDASGSQSWQPIKSDFFYALMCDILRFFTEGNPSVPAEQTIEIMKIREKALAAVEKSGQWVEI